MRSSKFIDLYAILEVQRNCNDEQIKVAYKRLALARHPDKNLDDPNATAHFQVLVDAFEVLSNQSKRTTYNLEWDRQNAQRAASSSKDSIPKQSSFKQQTSQEQPFEPSAPKPSSSNYSTCTCFTCCSTRSNNSYNNYYYNNYKSSTAWSPYTPPPSSDDKNDYSTAQYSFWAGETRFRNGQEYVWGSHWGKWQWILRYAGCDWVFIESTKSWVRASVSTTAQQTQPPPQPESPLRPDAASFEPQVQSAKAASGPEPQFDAKDYVPQRFSNYDEILKAQFGFVPRSGDQAWEQ